MNFAKATKPLEHMLLTREDLDRAISILASIKLTQEETKEMLESTESGDVYAENSNDQR